MTSTQAAPSLEEVSTRLARMDRMLAAVHRITSALAARTNVDDLVRQTLETAIGIVDASAGSILLHDAEKDALVFKYVIAATEEITQQLTGMELPVAAGVCGRVYQSGQAEITEDVTADASHDTSVDAKTQYVTRNMCTVPLPSSEEGQTIGVMQILNRKAGDFDESDLEVLEILAVQAAGAIETARLHQEAQLARVVNLIGDISHDVKNMITPVVTGTQTLELMMQGMFEDLDSVLKDPDMGEELKEKIDYAIGAVKDFYPEAVAMTYDGARDTQERVREIADAIKGIVSEPHFEIMPLRDVVDSVTKALGIIAENNGISIAVEGLDDLPEMEIDRKGMYNAFYNLINNAIPETPAGGRITVRAEAIRINGEQWIQIQVADTGRGMPAHVRERLFSDNTVSTKPGGTGLGTRIVKNVVDLHHGTIKVDSGEGQGTTFTITLPRLQPEREEAAAVA